MAIKVMEIELAEQINPIRKLGKYEGFRILVRYRGRPLGWAYVSNSPWEQTIAIDRVRQTIVDQLGKEFVRSTLVEFFGQEPAAVSHRHLPSMSVVICTRNRTVPRLEIWNFVCSQWLNRLLLGRLMIPGRLIGKLVVSELLGVLQSSFAYREAHLQAQCLAAVLGVEPLVCAGGVR
ncbi:MULTISPECIES: hypothetical protein [unclassified Microcoleus]|uniref:hypothetical protein n=1 Tax=unclassified Microcoleus TaxID=2642155 RepID=UPI002FD648CA